MGWTSSISGPTPARAAGYEKLVKEECSIIVPEHEFKMYSIRREPNIYDFTAGDAVVAFARESGLGLRGHTLLWNRADKTAQWMKNYDFGSNPRAKAEVFLRDYVQRVCIHFGEIQSWDVVNEWIDPLTGGLGDTPFSRILDFDALRIVFEAAREYAPRAQLVYNDYMSFEPSVRLHRNAVLKLLHDLRANNVPVDALGIQSHIHAAQRMADTDRREWISFLDEVVGMGYKMLITEFDVNDLGAGNDIQTRDQAVAAAGQDYLDVMLSYKQLDQFLCWGLVDKHSWLQCTVADPGPPFRPTPYDDDYQPKPLREAIAAAINAAPMR